MKGSGEWGALILVVVLTHPNVCVLFFLSDPAFQNFLADRSSWGFPRQPNIAQTLPLTDRLGLSPTLYSGAEKFSRGSHRRVWKEIWFSATTVNSSGFEWRPFSQETYKFKSDSNYRVWFFILKLIVPKIFEDLQTRRELSTTTLQSLSVEEGAVPHYL